MTGANGSGKSSLYRALRLLADCGQGWVIGSLAREGGLPSVLWAGPENLAGARRTGTVRAGPVSLRLGFAADPGFGYLVDLGLPVAHRSAFDRDPEIKRELVFSGRLMRPASTLVRRTRARVEARTSGGWEPLTDRLPTYASMLTELADPTRAPELAAVRAQIRGWRFYDGFRVDAHAPARLPQVGTRTPVLADDGSDLAAAVQTIMEQGGGDLEQAVADAFDRATISVSVTHGVFDVSLHQPGMLRPLRSAELSDGTLRYLLWTAALLTVDPPAWMVLNEPETSLHPGLLAPLSRLIRRAAAHTQVLVVSHARPLIEDLEVRPLGDHDQEHEDDHGAAHGDHGDHGDQDSRRLEIELSKDLGETRVDGQGLLTRPVWNWGVR